MRPQKVLDTDILIALTSVFRSKGYEGASLKDLSEATGLKKASLYHRFPAGKEEMANAVLNYINDWVEKYVFGVLLDQSISPESRLVKGLNGIRGLYDEGKENCIFRALSMQSGFELFGEQLENGFREWIRVFIKLGASFNLSPQKAEENAIQTLVELQGTLVVSKGLGSVDVFENTLKGIEHRYLNP